eukprot:CAMPEP_0184867318 /NCGR_PEP_ID=MMETSP0580-20130426/25985_1 /TAXON_ID=1118495 /ORGANISM="Dactyliosolen fragilissimus" /LENGTH=440 /DNA_ID=CAMNT_0027367521 /DNA_START=49 /DNA_END=1368 /DNA_ORIENTATION=+
MSSTTTTNDDDDDNDGEKGSEIVSNKDGIERTRNNHNKNDKYDAQYNDQRDFIQRQNWSGSIPVVLSLAPTSLSSPTMPSHIHCLVSRQTYLHLALEKEIRYFHTFAPITLNFHISSSFARGEEQNDEKPDEAQLAEKGKEYNNKTDSTDTKGLDVDTHGKHGAATNSSSNNTSKSAYPQCWFEDEESGIPLRWHLFAGVLYDLSRLRKVNNFNNSTLFPFRGNNQNVSNTFNAYLPWRIRVHFTSYPTSGLLHFDSQQGVLHTIHQNFSNNLKQALYIQHNTNKIALMISKQYNSQIWESIVHSRWESYREINDILQWKKKHVDMDVSPSPNLSEVGKSKMNDEDRVQNSLPCHIPLRVMVDGRPALAKACKPIHPDASKTDEKSINENNHEGDQKNTICPKQARLFTIGEILMSWLPDFFPSCHPSDSSNSHDIRCRW